MYEGRPSISPKQSHPSCSFNLAIARFHHRLGQWRTMSNVMTETHGGHVPSVPLRLLDKLPRLYCFRRGTDDDDSPIRADIGASLGTFKSEFKLCFERLMSSARNRRIRRHHEFVYHVSFDLDRVGLRARWVDDRVVNILSVHVQVSGLVTDKREDNT